MSATAFHLPASWLDRRLDVSLIGCGGSGSEVLDGLARIDRALRALGHPGLEVTAYDPDTVSETNTIRQRFWPADTGQNKAELLMHRYGMFGGLAGHGVAAPWTRKEAGARGLDLLVTCVDRATVRAEIDAFYRDAEHSGDTLWLDLGNGAREGQVILGHLCGWQGEAQRLPNVCDLFPELRSHAAELDADNGPSCSADEALSAQDLFVNRWVAVAACDLLWRLLRQGVLEAHGCFVAPDGVRVRELPIDINTWASFGLRAERETRAAA